jgi:alkylhydroperoxidase family enzyme
MSNIGRMRTTLVMRILGGAGETSASDRRAAFDDSGAPVPLAALVSKVARHANRVTDQDITDVKAAGISEDQIFEVVVCAAVGQATRQYDAALAALETATEKEPA